MKRDVWFFKWLRNSVFSTSTTAIGLLGKDRVETISRSLFTSSGSLQVQSLMIAHNNTSALVALAELAESSSAQLFLSCSFNDR